MKCQNEDCEFDSNDPEDFAEGYCIDCYDRGVDIG